MPRQKLPIVFGGGLDRDSGIMVVSPEAAREAENVYLYKGKFEPRGGMEQRSVVGAAEYVALVHAVRQFHRGIIVTGEGEIGMPSHLARVSLVSGSGRNPESIGVWMNPVLSQERLRAIAAESGTRVFIAHDEPAISRRGRTIYHDSQDAVPAIYSLTAEWARGGVPFNSDEIRFRGVTPWMDYLVGWGFWTNDEERSEAVRISAPGEPTNFPERGWQLPGQRGDPTLLCLPLSSGLLVLKESETHIIRGTHPRDFGVFMVEDRFGVAGARLGTVVGDNAFYWSLEGPRVSSGGASEDISWPLGLPWPSPRDIAAAGRLKDGFTCYMPSVIYQSGGQTFRSPRMVLFVFYDWVYAWHLDKQEWAHWSLGEPVHAAGILYSLGFEGPSRGYPDFVSATAQDGDTQRIAWVNVSAEGDETVELWVRRVGDAWPGVPSAYGNVGGVAYADANGLFTGDYEAALRYERDGQYTAGYTGAPDTWPAVSRGTFSVATPAPSITSTAWSRQSAVVERIAVTYAGTFNVQILRNTVNDPDTATIIAEPGNNDGTYNDEGLAGLGETTVYYWARHINPDATLGPVGAVAQRWVGPDAPAGLIHVVTNGTYPADFYSYRIDWTAYPGGADTRVWDDYVCTGVFALRGTTNLATWTQALEKNSAGSEDGSEPNATLTVRVRHEVTTFGVTDNSDNTQIQLDARIRPDETAWNECP